MAFGDKVSNKAEELGGKAKESLGAATGNDELRAEGRADQAAANAKQAGEHVKDAAKDLFGDKK
ncbi:CsbD family protein [Agrococcus sp. ARC_14]|uniref:CsbD family protein n=1 Tax=Agrococcus sp. ARC_14 TaxID=2919927 RepID=UPI001F05B80C|nr:CsbD family protein [Agrococcus sp. ARC_14]MCH1881992.1 CsbD family protein [Agrococcus sp. ARC_14]